VAVGQIETGGTRPKL